MPTPLAPALIPEPRQIAYGGTAKLLRSGKKIAVSAPNIVDITPIATSLQQSFAQFAGVSWTLRSGQIDEASTGLLIAVETMSPMDEKHLQAYVLDTTGDAITLQAISPAGVFYGAQTLKQLLRQYGAKLPRMRIDDYPDFARRGVMLDISRDKVPTRAELFKLVELLASLKINELQLYTEHTFAFEKHATVWKNASPITPEDILALDAHCRAHFIDLVPNQVTFGHMRRFLIHETYRDLSEAPDGCDTRWGRFDRPFTLNPGDPRSLALVGELLDDVVPNFSSRFVNVNCDETVDLGEGRSKTDVQARGAGRVYLDFVLKIQQLVKQHGRTMQFWGDIIMEHPELVPELPKDAIALEWGYEYDHPFAEHGARYAASGVPFYVCPGTSSWRTIGGRTDNMIGNIINAAENGIKHGAVGLLNTDWGDLGHLQPLVASYLGYAFGAAASWCLAENRDIDLSRASSMHVFGDASGAAGKLAYDIGNIYRLYPKRTFNSTAYFHGIVDNTLNGTVTEVPPAVTKAVLAEIARLERALRALKLTTPEAAIVKQEWAYALAVIRYGAQRLARMNAGQKASASEKATLKRLLALHKKVWLLRNRPGGIADSAANLAGKPDDM
jgi:hexosaminidase